MLGGFALMAGIDYSKLHESESVHLLLGHRVLVAELRPHFIEAGFTEEDDFFFLPRQDGCYPWQSNDIVTVDFFDGDRQVDCDGVCDRAHFNYLFASLPAAHIATFVSTLGWFRGVLGGELEHRSEMLDPDGVRSKFDGYIRDLLDEVNEQPGSESLAILIQDSYPRR
jgi:hypothetical protein